MTKKQLSERAQTKPILPSLGGTLKQQALLVKQMLETAPCGIALVSTEGTLKWMNKRFVQCFGYAQKEMVGMSVQKLVPLRLRNKQAKGQERYFKSPYTRPLGTGKVFMGLCQDETETPFDIGFSPFSTKPEYGITTWVIPMRPHQYENPFSQFIEQVIENASEHILIVGRNYRVQHVNRAYEVAHDISRQDIVEKHVAHLLGEDVFQGSVKSYLNLSFAGETVKYCEQVRLAGIGTRMMVVNYLPIYTAEGEVGAVMVIASEQTNQDMKKEKYFLQSLLCMQIALSNDEKDTGAEPPLEENSLQQKIRCLSGNQQAILTLVARGKTNKEIAGILDLGEKTIRNNLTVIFRALGVSRRAEAVAVFVRLSVSPGNVGIV